MEQVSSAATIVNTATAITSIRNQSFCMRFCPYWRMSAGLICLATSVIAIFSAMAWRANLLYFPFSLGAVCSGYNIYLGYQYKNVKTFEESNEKLKEEINRLHDGIGQNLDRFQNLNTVLDNLTETMREDHKELGTTLNTIAEEIKNNSAEAQSSLITQLEAKLVDAFRQVESWANADDERKKSIQQLQQLRKELTTAQSKLDQTIVLQQEVQKKFKEEMKKEFENNQKMSEQLRKDAEEVATNTKRQSQLLESFEGKENNKKYQHD